MEKLLQWSGNIINHFWYYCRTCEGDGGILKVSTDDEGIKLICNILDSV